MRTIDDRSRDTSKGESRKGRGLERARDETGEKVRDHGVQEEWRRTTVVGASSLLSRFFSRLQIL